MNILRHIREWFGLSQSKMMLNIPLQVKKDAKYWFEECRRKSEGKEHLICPWKGCEGGMLSGPSGGMAENIQCDTCGRKWNMMAMIGSMEQI